MKAVLTACSNVAEIYFCKNIDNFLGVQGSLCRPGQHFVGDFGSADRNDKVYRP
ncbi:hypothetical protein [Pedobacter sp. ISL-64]|uniref:hypothetical protein n=1 Tax=Pedobacter sp. ISL-64 TaxID=2819164 RepID=UPI001BE97E62|nr:hypothetical protein [Pedobacter sp. ISL-64]MBT2561305.1 hypothetical protein [Pedobacter sp. ISL-64]